MYFNCADDVVVEVFQTIDPPMKGEREKRKNISVWVNEKRSSLIPDEDMDINYKTQLGNSSYLTVSYRVLI